MGIKFNPLSGQFDLVGSGATSGSVTPVGPVNLANNTVTTGISIPLTNIKILIDYSITRNGETRVGSLDIASNGTTASFADGGYVETANVGVTWSLSISGPNILVQATTTNTGFAAPLISSIGVKLSKSVERAGVAPTT